MKAYLHLSLTCGIKSYWISKYIIVNGEGQGETTRNLLTEIVITVIMETSYTFGKVNLKDPQLGNTLSFDALYISEMRLHCLK